MSESITLSVNPETICFLILKAHEFQTKEEVILPEEPFGPSDEWALEVLADHSNDPSYAELKNTVNDLEPDQQVALVALMWLGRGDYEVEEWDQALAAAGDAWNPRTAEYLIATPLVADYLDEGLSLLGYSCEE